MATKQERLEGLLVQAVEAGLKSSPHDARQIAMRLGRPSQRSALVSEATRQRFQELTADPEIAARSARPSATSRELSPTLAVGDMDSPASVEAVAGQVAPLLPEQIIERLHRIVREQGRREDLLAVGARPTSTVLLSGPPGVGKTHTARWLAAELALPLVHIEPAEVVSSLLGRSGQNLIARLEAARSQPSVVLIDEFDALAKRRDDGADIGELKRLVTVLLLELDRWPSGHLLVAATNHPHLLDPAVLRRFDHEIHLELPDQDLRFALLSQALDARGLSVSCGMVSAIVSATDGAHGGDMVSLADQIARAVVVDDQHVDKAAGEIAMGLLEDKDGEGRDAFCWVAHNHAGLPMREIARYLGVSHPTVSTAISRFNGDAAA